MKRIVAWALLLCMLAALLPISAFAEEAEGVVLEIPEEEWTDPMITVDGEEAQAAAVPEEELIPSEQADEEETTDEGGYISLTEEEFAAQSIPEANGTESIVDSGACGDNLTWTLDDEGTLTISGSGAMWDYTNSSSAAPWYSNRDSIRRVEIDSTVTSIGSYAFYFCRSLTSITIPEGVTSIGDYAFCGCSGLKSLTIPESLIKIGRDLFSYCRGLESIYVAEDNLHFCTVDGILFSKDMTAILCYPAAKTETVYTVPSTVQRIEDDAFSFNSSLSDIVFPEGLVSIGTAAFHDCTGLTEIRLPGSVKSVGSLAFWYCSNLTAIQFSSNVDTIFGGAFSSCTNLRTVIYEGAEIQKKSRIDKGYSTEMNESLFAAAWQYINPPTGWLRIGDAWYYLDEAGVTKTGWLSSGGSWYYMASNGVMQTGWLKDSGKRYYLKASGAMATGWLKLEGTWYYFETGGAMTTGWKKVAGKWYYFASTGAMVTGLEAGQRKVVLFHSLRRGKNGLGPGSRRLVLSQV